MKPENDSKSPVSSNRREFLGKAASVVTAAVGTSLVSPEAARAEKDREDGSAASGQHRQAEAFQLREDAARKERVWPMVEHPANGDEDRYASKIANYSKGLPHNMLGEVDLAAWRSLVRALTTGEPSDFERILTSSGTKLVNPQAGLAFSMEGPDSHVLTIRPAPAFSSAEQAGELAENSWMALVRDVPFTEYATNATTMAACADLSRLSDFRGPKEGGRVTPGTLFRGPTRGGVIGPHISQFLWQDTPYGAETISRQMQTTIPGVDYLTTYPVWLAAQHGAFTGTTMFDPTPRYIRSGRDLAEWVHHDVLFQGYFNALLILFRWGTPVDSGNPYRTSSTQIGFGTLGDPYIASVLCAVAREALKAVWFQKWYVHRRMRPEVFGGRVHNHVIGAARYPIHSDILTSAVLPELFRRNHSYLLPQSYPEGSPTHPSYGAGHATVAGACVTVLKAFFEESFVVPDPVETSPDGLRLMSYSGPPLTVGGELDKLASNVGTGRNIAGIHWRSDLTESLKLGEELAIRYLREENSCFNEDFHGYSLTKFDGTQIIV